MEEYIEFDFIIKFIPFVILTLGFGYLISSINYFKTKRLFRIFSYILVTFIIISPICVLLYKNDIEFNERILSNTGPSFFGLMIWVHSFWFYIGTRIRKNYRKKNRFTLIKKIIAGILLLTALIGLWNLKNDFIDLCIYVTYITFGWLLTKKHSIIVEETSNYEKPKVPITEKLNHIKDFKLKNKKQPLIEEHLISEEKKSVSKVESKTDNLVGNKTVLYTFFFGYFSLKWRRLIRVLILVPVILFLILGFLVIISDGEVLPFDGLNSEIKNILTMVLLILIYLLPFLLISWVVKPFVVKE